MNRIRARFLGGGYDLVDDQVALRRRARANMHGLIRHALMQGFGVRIGIDGDRRNAHFARGLDHAAGNLPAIGDQDFCYLFILRFLGHKFSCIIV